jgi:eukaryotic-like serine/threonine-protein kinase
MPEEVQGRPRTSTRARAEAPPGMGLAGDEGRKAIGRYEVVKTIGKGAMGVVYKARDPLLDRTVAIKTIMSPQQSGRRVRSAFLERFQREAKAAAKMSHPAIVTIFDVGVDEDSGAPFMVLEYLPGESLADRLDRVRLPLARCVQIGLDLASALSFAHRQRIVHRDVKPANVLHAGDNRWKLADFGIARLPDSDLTQVGIFMGTPGYSPPEAIREGRYTPQADVFAWGAVMYEMLSGRIPYEGPDTKTTNGYVVQGNALPVTRHDSSIPEPLSAVAMTALQPSDKSRFRDASEAEQQLREAWERCLTQGLVHPAVLAMDEMSHDKAPARMHEARGSLARASASSFDEAEAPRTEKSPAPVIISSTKRRGSEDDPTKIVVRDEIKPAKPDATSRGIGGATGKTPAPAAAKNKDSAQGSGGRSKPVTGKREPIVDSRDTEPQGAPAMMGDPPLSVAELRAAARAVEPSKGLPKVLVVGLAIVLVLAIAATVLYFTGTLAELI